jgi:hypothetical protein
VKGKYFMIHYNSSLSYTFKFIIQTLLIPDLIDYITTHIAEKSSLNKQDQRVEGPISKKKVY